MKRGMELQTNQEEIKNYIFYVSDYVDVCAGHAWKMDRRRAMTEQMEETLSNCKVMKYTEYHGETLDAESVGILFPSKTWGISLAVYAFLQNLRIRRMNDGLPFFVYRVFCHRDGIGKCDIIKKYAAYIRFFQNHHIQFLLSSISYHI